MPLVDTSLQPKFFLQRELRLCLLVLNINAMEFLGFAADAPALRHERSVIAEP